MEGILVPIALFFLIFAILYVYYTTRTKERLALVEKGKNANVFQLDDPKFHILKWGVVLIMLSVGIIGGYALSNVINEVVAYFTSILLFGGIGLTSAYFLTTSLSKKEE